MTYYVVSYPDLATLHQRWIEAIRRDRDPQAAIIGPHITFVFGIAGIDEGRLIGALRGLVERQPPLDVRFSAIECHRGFGEDTFYAYLVPDEGRSALESLHRSLHDGLSVPQGEGVPAFVPHVTLGRAGDRAGIEELIAAHPLPDGGIPAPLTGLTLVARYKGGVRTLARFAFSP